MAAFQSLPLIAVSDDAGLPLVGGKIFTYESGTLTLKTTFSDTAQTVQNTNPVILNARGEALMVLGSGAYTLEFARADNSVVRTVNGVVDDTAALSITTNSGIASIRTDLSSALDPLKGSALVGFSASGTGAIALNIQSVLRQWKTFEQFGAIGDGVADDTTAMTAAVTSLSTSGGVIKAGNGKTYNYTSVVYPADATAGIIIEGYGATFRKTSVGGNGFVIRGTAGPGGPTGGKRRGSGIHGGRFTHSVAQASGSTIHIEDAEHTQVKDFEIELPYIGIFVKNCFNIHIKGKSYIRNSGLADIYLQGTGTTPTTIDIFIDGVLGEGTSGNTTKVGLVVDSGVSGVYASNCDYTHGSTGVRFSNTIFGTPRPEFLFFSQVLCDTNASSGWFTEGDVVGVFYNTCWGATAGGAGSGFELSNGTGHFLTNCQAFNNARHGVNISGAAEVHVNGGLFSGNSKSAANTYSGVRVAPGVSGFSVKNARSGNLVGVGSGVQKHGIDVAAGASNSYQLLANDLRENGTSSLNDQGTGVSKRLHDNQGFNPRAFMGVVTTPATGVALTNPFGTDASVYIVGGTITVIEINGSGGFVTTGVTTGHVRVPAGAQIRLTYTGSPTTTWVGD